MYGKKAPNIEAKYHYNESKRFVKSFPGGLKQHDNLTDLGNGAAALDETVKKAQIKFAEHRIFEK